MADSMTLSLFARRVLIVIGLGILAFVVLYFLRIVSYGLLVLFAGVLFAVLLHGMAKLLYDRTPIPPRWALVIAIFLFVAILTGAFSFGGMRIANEAPILSRRIARSIDQLHADLEQSEIGRKVLNSAEHNNDQGKNDQGNNDEGDNDEDQQSAVEKHAGQAASLGAAFVSRVRDFVAITIGAVTDIFITLIVGLYLAAAPGFYIGASLRLVPIERRRRYKELFAVLGHALRRWLLGRFLSMLFVGIITTVGLIYIGIPLAALLGVIAAALTFVPYLGTIFSVVPAMLLALLVSPLTAVYVGLLYLAAHILEGYILAPLIQHRAVHLAPAFLIGVQLLGGLMAGIIGIILAAPLAVTITIVIQELYIEDILNDRPHILGEDEEGEPTV
jgi:predicted PurR-regulated permease PerM